LKLDTLSAEPDWMVTSSRQW